MNNTGPEATNAVQLASGVAIPWDTINQDSWSASPLVGADLGVSTSQIVVGHTAKRVRLSWCVVCEPSNNGTMRGANLSYSGGAIKVGSEVNSRAPTGNDSPIGIHGTTPVITVAPGQTFELLATFNTGAADPKYQWALTRHTYFMLEEIDTVD